MVLLNPDDLPILSTERGMNFEREELGGGMFRLIQHMKPTAFFRDGAWRAMVNDYINDGLGGHAIVDSPLMVTIGDDANGRATRRLHPTRELDVWVEIGRPYNVTTRTPYALNPFVRDGNLLTSTNTLANVMIWHGGHFSKLGIQLKGTWRTSPPAQFAFPVALQGLTWEGGGIIAKNGIPVMRLTAPEMYDLDNPLLRRAIPWDFVQLAGQWYVVFDTPSTAGMSRPLIDPTLELQPDATSGVDAFIFAATTTTNYGAHALLAIGNAAVAAPFRTWIRFTGLSAIPANAILSSVVFSLRRNGGAGTGTRTAEVYRLKRLPVEGQITWNNSATATPWTTAGGFDPADCEQTAIGSLVQVNTDTGFQNWTLTPTSVAALDLGYGWLNKTTVETQGPEFYYDSSDATTAANRPKLATVYALPGGRGVFTIPFGNAFQGAFGA